MTAEAPTAIDLFAGAGGMSEGFVRAGFKVLGAVELDETAARTYRLNHPGLPDERVLVHDIRTLADGALTSLAGRRTLDVLAGAPPARACPPSASAPRRHAPVIDSTRTNATPCSRTWSPPPSA